jgi:hypothetical protein
MGTLDITWILFCAIILIGYIVKKIGYYKMVISITKNNNMTKHQIDLINQIVNENETPMINIQANYDEEEIDLEGTNKN